MSDRDDHNRQLVRLGGDYVQPGTMLRGRYVVLGRVAETRLSTVYQGADQHTGRVLAIKQLAGASHPDSLPRASAIRALVSEARLLREIDHPQLPRVRAAFHERGEWFLITDYVAGQPLSRLLDDGLVTPALAWEIAGSLCDVVVALHHCSPPVIHADIKPNNVIVGTGGRVTLLDFGLARRLGAPAAAGAVMGTPPYTPPEQWCGQPLDQRSDVFALATVIAELFEVAGIRSLRATLARATAPERQDRLASAARLRQALAVAHAIEEARRPTPWLVLDRWTILAWLTLTAAAAMLWLGARG